jgi:hypothetical protein
MDKLIIGAPRIEGVCPCDDCRHTKICKENELACRSFGSYVAYNFFFTEAVRIPSKESFKKIFNTKEDAKELREYLKKFMEEDNENQFKSDGKE